MRALLLALLLAALFAPAATAQDLAAENISRAVSTSDAMATVAALDAIAVANGGNRETGKPGFARSREYVENALRRAGYDVVAQPVPYRDFAADTETLTAPDGRRIRTLMAQFVPSGQVTGPLADAGAGCSTADYPKGTAIAVIRSGDCPSGDKTVAARDAGVQAVLVYDAGPAIDAAIRRQVPHAALPVGFLSQRDASALTAAPGSAQLELRGHTFDDTAVSLFAETSGGHPDSVVMAGAHLDSAVDGPGINDNGSSVAALLETAIRLAPFQDRVPNKVRFAFWGAEELIDIGSSYYIDTRTPAEVAAIALYLNWEMIGSPNYAHFVMDGDGADHPGGSAGPPGSGTVKAVMAQGYQIQGVPYRTADLAQIGSDQEPFARAGIPIGGAFGGVRALKTPEEAAVFGGVAGQPYDPCYHQPCDNLANVNPKAFEQALRAMAWAVARFAVDDHLKK
ncbi:M20/M25/M40 family metallo-hydrolase [Nocardia panacis]|nr:M20/M25/M40 family metallo-hydrolase [Nocardia panacis]